MKKSLRERSEKHEREKIKLLEVLSRTSTSTKISFTKRMEKMNRKELSNK